MSTEIIDACCLVNLFASGEVEVILGSSSTPHYVSKHVEAESVSIRRPAPHDPTIQISLPIDLSNVMNSGLVRRCDLENEEETRLFVEFAARIDDGEASCLAIAKSRGWIVATDDRKALRLAAESDIEVVTTPELIQRWIASEKPSAVRIQTVIDNIECYAKFRLGRNHPHFSWWMNNRQSET